MLKMTFQRKSKRLIPSAIELFQVKISLSYCKISTKTIWILRQRATTSQNSQIQLSLRIVNDKTTTKRILED